MTLGNEVTLLSLAFFSQATAATMPNMLHYVVDQATHHTICPLIYLQTETRLL